jgi:cyanophycin synthetase
MVLMGQAGDRSDHEIAAFVSAACDLHPEPLLICDMPGYERGRESGAVAQLIGQLAIDQGLPAEALRQFDTPLEGVKYALSSARKGDCLVLLALTQRDEALALVQEFVSDK